MRLLSVLLTSAALLLGLAALGLPAVAQTGPQPTPEAQAVIDAGRKLEADAKLDEAVKLYEPALEKARAAGDRKGEGLLLIRLGAVAQRRNQHVPAAEFFEKSLAIGRELKDPFVLSPSLRGLAASFYAMGELPKAMAHWREALPIIEAAGDRALAAGTRMNIGVVLENTGELKQARDMYETSLATFVALGDRLGETNCLLNLGAASFKLNEYEKGFDYTQRARALYRELKRTSDEANALMLIGLGYRNLGDVKKASEVFNEALALAREARNPATEAYGLANVAGIYADFGQPERALALYREALAIKKRLGDVRGEAVTSSSLGWALIRIGDTKEGLELVEHSLEIFRRAGDRRQEAIVLRQLGFAYHQMELYAEEESSLRQALAISAQMGDKRAEAAALNGLAAIQLVRKRGREALDLYRQALAPMQALGDKPSVAGLLGNLGDTYRRLGQLSEARDYQLQALRLFRELRDQNGIANTLEGLGSVAMDGGKPAEARYYFREGVKVAHLARNRLYEAKSANELGHAELKLGASEEATRHYGYAVSLLESFRSNLGGYSQAKSAFLGGSIDAYYDYLRGLLRANRNAEAFAVAQKTKARSLLDLLESGRVDLDASLTPDEKIQYQDLNLQSESLNAAMVQQGVENEVGSKKRYEALKKQLEAVETQLNQLTTSLYARRPELAAKRIAQTTTLDRIGKLLPADTALLDYVVAAQDDVRLFVVTSSGGQPRLTVRKISGAYSRLAGDATRFRAACADPRKPYAPLSRKLYNALLLPVQAQLSGKSRLIICPDGALWDVPFQALSAGRAGFAGERFAIAYAYSATGAEAAMLPSAKPRTPASGTILVAANPAFGSSERFRGLQSLATPRPIDTPSRPIDTPSRPIDTPSRPIDSASRPLDLASRAFDAVSRPLDRPSRRIASAARPIDTPSRSLGAPEVDTRGKAIPPLPGTQREADMLGKLFPGAEILTGAAAQEATIKRLAGDYRYLHLATHGFVNDGSPLLSSVVLASPPAPDPASGGQTAGAAPPAEDGFLTAREIYGMNLKAEMTVLSACNTARGENRTGEGVVGLTWALFVAGCPTQVVSQWAVDDAGTALLMGRFYENLKVRKLGKARALQDAETWLRGRDPKYRHPYYWAPFVLNGAWK